MKKLKTQAHWNSFKRIVLALVISATTVVGCLEAKAETIYGVNDELNELVAFDSATPGTLLSAMCISGLQSGEQIRGIASVNGTLYGLGDSSRLYTLNVNTAAATQVGTGQFSPVLNGIYFGFHAGTSQLYVSSDLGQNLTINPVTGVATAGPNYTGAVIDAMVYNPVNTLFYGLSPADHDLYLMNPVTGATTLVGPTGVDFAAGIGFDISPTTDVAYFSGTVGGQTVFFEVNLATGFMTLVGGIGVPGELSSGLDGMAVFNGTSTWVDFNYTDGGQNGSYNTPFATLAQGTNAVPAFGTITLKGPSINANQGPAISHETMKISKPMFIIAVGGPATIGQ
jgi:hypothetical protein